MHSANKQGVLAPDHPTAALPTTALSQQLTENVFGRYEQA